MGCLKICIFQSNYCIIWKIKFEFNLNTLIQATSVQWNGYFLIQVLMLGSRCAYSILGPLPVIQCEHVCMHNSLWSLLHVKTTDFMSRYQMEHTKARIHRLAQTYTHIHLSECNQAQRALMSVTACILHQSLDYTGSNREVLCSVLLLCLVPC